MSKYRPAPGSHLKKGDAQVLGQVMARLHQEHRLTREDLLAAARDASSAIHHLYEWHDGRAAELYRLEQSAYYLRSVDIIVTDKGGKETATRFAYVREGAALPYVTVSDIGRDHSLAQEIADQLYTGAWEWLATYRQYCRQFRVQLRPLSAVAKSIGRVKKRAV